ncbi:hypothetical protein KSP39_PZI004297 [Platanthera zijinensis]|uniref:Uncharacterized protein n=1 Tax=Platanthera zijinensis TaxID=2320716 RepID=A0AAP0BY52_9ASPA
MDSRILMKPDEYYEPNYTKRFQEEYCGYGKGSKHDGSRDDKRGKNNRYEVLHPKGHLESNDNMRIDSQNVDLPRRIKGGMVPFRRGGDAKSNKNLKPFNVREANDDILLQRRSS